MKINFNKNKYAVLAIFFAFVFLAPFKTAEAQIFGSASTSAPEKPICELDKAMDNLLKTKDSDLSGTVRDRAEFKARKEVLIQTVICAQEEISSAENRLTELKPETENDKNLAGQFAADLASATVKYGFYSDEIATSTGLLEVKDLASGILKWRNDVYLPLLQQVNDFVLVINSERAVQTAEARFGKISTSLSILRLSQIYGIKTALDSAAKQTNKASALNAEARSIVDSYIRATSTATSTEPLEKGAATSTGQFNAASSASSSTETIDLASKSAATSTAAEVKAQPKVIDMVKESLSSLKLAYNDYLKISGLVKQILGL